MLCCQVFHFHSFDHEGGGEEETASFRTCIPPPKKKRVELNLKFGHERCMNVGMEPTFTSAHPYTNVKFDVHLFPRTWKCHVTHPSAVFN